MARIQTPQQHGKRWRVRSAGRDWITFDTKDEAEDFLLDMRRDRHRQDFREKQAEAAGVTVDEFRETWLRTRVGEVTHATYRAQDYDYRKWVQPWIGHKRLKRIDAADLREWLDTIREQGASAHARNKSRLALSAILTAAANRRLIPRNPLTEKLPDGKPVIPYVDLPTADRKSATWDEVLLLMKQEDYLALLVRCIAELGLRSSEACGLTVDTLYLEGRAPYVRVRQVAERGKTELRLDTKARKRGAIMASRDVPMSLDLAAALREHVGDRTGREPVFRSLRGKRWDYNNLQRVFNRVRVEAGLEHLTLHSLRHYCCTAWFEAGLPPHSIQKWMGHSKLETTLLYAHTTDAAADAARSMVR
jgi:integrase